MSTDRMTIFPNYNLNLNLKVFSPKSRWPFSKGLLYCFNYNTGRPLTAETNCIIRRHEVLIVDRFNCLNGLNVKLEIRLTQDVPYALLRVLPGLFSFPPYGRRNSEVSCRAGR